ncbi:hypothetical protein HYPSUDRAFT_56497 [Hypholoma sublateritium FD-334 SS-4]|uniref:Uncharacterized protein n=1 Tax=Hypholoma sublateritium (strain FD-334 SS-4) TaxID=945553 RepID=A0A0D2KYT3_HYPSF|nr:hypothetical protein HYPSUDRAFT_56497 [Hypholoma sublateritium FD-334 SS-4]
MYCADGGVSATDAHVAIFQQNGRLQTRSSAVGVTLPTSAYRQSQERLACGAQAERIRAPRSSYGRLSMTIGRNSDDDLRPNTQTTRMQYVSHGRYSARIKRRRAATPLQCDAATRHCCNVLSPIQRRRARRAADGWCTGLCSRNARQAYTERRRDMLVQPAQRWLTGRHERTRLGWRRTCASKQDSRNHGISVNDAGGAPSATRTVTPAADWSPVTVESTASALRAQDRVLRRSRRTGALQFQKPGANAPHADATSSDGGDQQRCCAAKQRRADPSRYGTQHGCTISRTGPARGVTYVQRNEYSTRPGDALVTSGADRYSRCGRVGLCDPQAAYESRRCAEKHGHEQRRTSGRGRGELGATWRLYSRALGFVLVEDACRSGGLGADSAADPSLSYVDRRTHTAPLVVPCAHPRPIRAVPESCPGGVEGSPVLQSSLEAGLGAPKDGFAIDLAFFEASSRLRRHPFAWRGVESVGTCKRVAGLPGVVNPTAAGPAPQPRFQLPQPPSPSASAPSEPRPHDFCANKKETAGKGYRDGAIGTSLDDDAIAKGSAVVLTHGVKRGVKRAVSGASEGGMLSRGVCSCWVEVFRG